MGNGIETGRTSFGGASQVPEYMILNCNVNGVEGFPLNGYAGDALCESVSVSILNRAISHFSSKR